MKLGFLRPTKFKVIFSLAYIAVMACSVFEEIHSAPDLLSHPSPYAYTLIILTILNFPAGLFVSQFSAKPLDFNSLFHHVRLFACLCFENSLSFA